MGRVRHKQRVEIFLEKCALRSAPQLEEQRAREGPPEVCRRDEPSQQGSLAFSLKALVLLIKWLLCWSLNKRPGSISPQLNVFLTGHRGNTRAHQGQPGRGEWVWLVVKPKVRPFTGSPGQLMTGGHSASIEGKPTENPKAWSLP